ncbi:UDP-N-acetylmuramate dehydrogenase [Desulfotomaculum copahuensis]|uniref:UDP-N-acetylenolpyruvoylglucosamine reductase n=1 Tax=Desulfotomaculum copahuensis TaxID=1838280 RepID=A0A1B7LF13_9FIRM|nr:UDP-N-acetylmuramate dehydrogenase [Desulfotomaculum copahuensis]OAT81807.1 UDP-N-acetylenolpyruvoylglucosamine reductase [Desulfotomaculum copahuensis]
MSKAELFSALNAILPGRVFLDEPMSRHTTWRIGGPADILVEPDGVDGLTALIALLQAWKLTPLIIGNGSNLLVRDGGIRGVVVKIGRGLGGIKITGAVVTAGAGAALGALAAAARDAGVGGLAFAAGIPGTVGGAVVMNAGAHGSSMRDVVQEVLVMDYSGCCTRLPAAALDFGYRTSCLKGAPLIVLEATCRGGLQDPAAIRREMEGYQAKRRATQPLTRPSAGSVFRNPPGRAAGQLIEQAGAKGMRSGDAQVSTLHGNFIINLGAATARDVLDLIRRVQDLVYDRFGATLTLEVQILGED